MTRRRLPPVESASPSRTGEVVVDLARYIARQRRRAQLERSMRLLAAIERRDLAAVWHVLDSDAPGTLSRAVREEAIALAQLPHSRARAPIHLFRYQSSLMHLDDEPLPQAELDVLGEAVEGPARVLDLHRPDDPPPPDHGDGERRTGEH